MNEQGIFGYKLENGKVVVDEDEAKAVKAVVEKFDVYMKHPPKELVDAVIEECAIEGEDISYEEAEKRVSYEAIVDYITCEINREFPPKKAKRKAFATTELEPIVSEEVFNKACEIMQMQ